MGLMLLEEEGDDDGVDAYEGDLKNKRNYT